MPALLTGVQAMPRPWSKGYEGSEQRFDGPFAGDSQGD